MKDENKTIEALNNSGEVVIKVTTTTLYSFPKGSVNGWDSDSVVKDWFEDGKINAFHATRNHYEVGGSKTLKKVDVFEPDD